MKSENLPAASQKTRDLSTMISALPGLSPLRIALAAACALLLYFNPPFDYWQHTECAYQNATF